MPLADEDARISPTPSSCDAHCRHPATTYTVILRQPIPSSCDLIAGSVRAAQLNDFTDPAIKSQDDDSGRRRMTTVGVAEKVDKNEKIMPQNGFNCCVFFLFNAAQ